MHYLTSLRSIPLVSGPIAAAIPYNIPANIKKNAAVNQMFVPSMGLNTLYNGMEYRGIHAVRKSPELYPNPTPLARLTVPKRSDK